MSKRAVIIGGSGQDGIEMTFIFKKKKYELISIIKKNNPKTKKNYQ